MTSSKQDLLLQAEKKLEQALAQTWQSREQAWLENLRKTLSQVEGAMFRHKTPSEGQLSRPLEATKKEASPGLSRDVQALRDEHTGISQQINALLAGTVVSAPGAGHFARFRESGEKLLQALREFRETENKLVLETSLRDTGAGD